MAIQDIAESISDRAMIVIQHPFLRSRSIDADPAVARDVAMLKPLPTSARLRASLGETPYDLNEFVANHKSKDATVLYLAYGSNLSTETFRRGRGIRPISQINVQVPSLRLTFDLPGIPYAEPCFANSGHRDPSDDPSEEVGEHCDNIEKTLLLKSQRQREEHGMEQWHKGLIGVVYEVTASDYAHIIATEGGGASYHDILVECHPFASPNPSLPVPQQPTTPHFKAHTLFAPAATPGEDPPKDGGRFQRPDTSYAQASPRYLKLITDGARELNLPYEYQDYLQALKPYRITTNKQRLGQFVFLSIWMPFILLLFALGRMLADDRGRLPMWMRQLSGAIFKAAWASYDDLFRNVFGDGERTITDGGTGGHSAKARYMGETGSDLEKAQATT